MHINARNGIPTSVDDDGGYRKFLLFVRLCGWLWLGMMVSSSSWMLSRIICTEILFQINKYIRIIIYEK